MIGTGDVFRKAVVDKRTWVLLAVLALCLSLLPLSSAASAEDYDLSIAVEPPTEQTDPWAYQIKIVNKLSNNVVVNWKRLSGDALLNIPRGTLSTETVYVAVVKGPDFMYFADFQYQGTWETLTVHSGPDSANAVPVGFEVVSLEATVSRLSVFINYTSGQGVPQIGTSFYYWGTAWTNPMTIYLTEGDYRFQTGIQTDEQGPNYYLRTGHVTIDGPGLIRFDGSEAATHQFSLVVDSGFSESMTFLVSDYAEGAPGLLYPAQGYRVSPGQYRPAIRVAERLNVEQPDSVFPKANWTLCWVTDLDQDLVIHVGPMAAQLEAFERWRTIYIKPDLVAPGGGVVLSGSYHEDQSSRAEVHYMASLKVTHPDGTQETLSAGPALLWQLLNLQWRIPSVGGIYEAQLTLDLVADGQTIKSFTQITTHESPLDPPLILSPNDGFLTNDSTVVFTGTSAEGDLIKVYIDGSLVGEATTTPWGEWELGIEELADGMYTFSFTASLPDGSCESEPMNLRGQVDTVPPVASVAVSGEPSVFGWHSEPVEVVLSGTDPGGSGVKQVSWCLNDGETRGLYGDMVALSISSEGSHTLSYAMADRAGNETIGHETINLDLTPPVVECSPMQDEYLLGEAVSCAAYDRLSGLDAFTIELNGEVSDGLQVVFDALGNHNLRAVATDRAGLETALELNVEVILAAEADFDPDVLVKMDNSVMGKGDENSFVTVYIEFPAEYDPSEIDLNTVLLNGEVSAVTDPLYAWVTTPALEDIDGDGLPERMMKFNRAAVEELATAGEPLTITVTGSFGQFRFEATTEVPVR